MAKTLAELERDRDETELECVRRFGCYLVGSAIERPKQAGGNDHE